MRRTSEGTIKVVRRESSLPVHEAHQSLHEIVHEQQRAQGMVPDTCLRDNDMSNE